MTLTEVLTKLDHNKEGSKILPEFLPYNIAVFDHQEFSYELLDIEIDDETKRIIFRIKDSILVPISRNRRDGTNG